MEIEDKILDNLLHSNERATYSDWQTLEAVLKAKTGMVSEREKREERKKMKKKVARAKYNSSVTGKPVKLERYIYQKNSKTYVKIELLSKCVSFYDSSATCIEEARQIREAALRRFFGDKWEQVLKYNFMGMSARQTLLKWYDEQQEKNNKKKEK